MKNLINNVLLVGCFLFLTMSIYAQEKTVTGTVTDPGGLPIPGVNVVIEGTTTGTLTDFDGQFSIQAAPGDVLVFSFMGLETVKRTVRQENIMNVAMAQDNASLDEVVVVGYGNRERRMLTGAVSTVDAEGIQDSPVGQISEKLQGKMAGVQITQPSGIPGEGLNVRIRGAASINGGTQPLYVVDGFPIVGDLNSINPDAIESISVLKDASATALYGSRGANGVVLIETKTGVGGETSVNLNAYRGIQRVPQRGRPDLMNAREFARFQREIREERAAYEGVQVSIPEEYQNPEEYGEGTNWYDVLLRDAIIENYSATITSNKENLQSTIVGSYFRQEGVLANSEFERMSLRANTRYQFNDRLSVGLNFAPSYSINATPNTDGVVWSGGILQGAMLTSPIRSPYNPDGSLALTATGAGMFPNPNWLRVANEVRNDTEEVGILANAFLEYEIFQDLIFRSTGNIQWINQRREFFSPSTAGAIFAPPPQPATGSLFTNSNHSWLSENTLRYDKTLGQSHNFDFLVGYTVQKYRLESDLINGQNYPDDIIRTIDAANNIMDVESEIQEWSLLSQLARLNYDYDGKYILSAVFRRDGSSRFGSNNRWGNFPSISGGWIASEEDFMQDQDLISFLKFTAGYGLTGNNNIGNYTYLASISPTNYVLGNSLVSGRSTSTLSNQDLGWEKSEQMDIGADFGLFQNRIYLSYNHFRKLTSDMLYPVTVPRASGFADIWSNVGSFKFWGHEIALNSRNFTGDFTWTTDANITFLENEVVQLGRDNTPIGGLVGDSHITQVGRPIGQFYGFVQEGVYVDQEDLNSSPVAATSEVGTIKYADVNGDGVIDQSDRTVIGDPNPDFYFGMTNSFTYKNFDLNVIMSGSYGNDILNRNLEYTTNLDGPFNVLRGLEDRWRSPEDPGSGRYPRAMVGTAFGRFINSGWISDASFLKVTNITLGYTKTLESLPGVRSVRLYGSVQNAFTFTDYDGVNPEVSNNGNNALLQGVDFAAYPVPRTFTVGANLNF